MDPIEDAYAALPLRAARRLQWLESAGYEVHRIPVGRYNARPCWILVDPQDNSQGFALEMTSLEGLAAEAFNVIVDHVDQR